MSSTLPGIDSLGALSGRRVLVRSDLNVPMHSGHITDDGRIRASLPTLKRLLDAGARLVVIAHLGRPQGAVDPTLSLEPVAVRLGELLGQPVAFAADLDDVSDDADIVLVENVRFDAGETSKDVEARAAYAGRLAALADVYVNDAFGAVHRAHASVHEITALLPSAAGDLVVQELEVLGRLTEEPARPYVVVLGGSKVSDKLAVIDSLLPTVDALLVGGGMCFTFLAAQGYEVGGSLLEPDQVEACRGFLQTGKVTLPVDVVVAQRVAPDAETRIVAATEMPLGWIGLDIGPETVALFVSRLADARTVFWNGPMGVFEMAPFAAGTLGVAEAIASRTEALTVVGGGDSAAAVRALGIDEGRFSHISTGGGASLEFLEGRRLPGLTALED